MQGRSARLVAAHPVHALEFSVANWSLGITSVFETIIRTTTAGLLGCLPSVFSILHFVRSSANPVMTAIQEQLSSPILSDFTALVANLHNVIDTIASQVINTIDARDPSIVSDKPSPPASSELLNAFRRFTKLSDEFSSYATSPSEHLTMIAGAFYESVALNVVSELGIADLIEKEMVPVNQLAKQTDVDEGRLRKSLDF